MPESVRSYMTIEEVRSLIATPMQNEGVKSAYLFSCFCGLRISDIIGLQWKNVFIDNGQYRLAVAMQKTKEPIYLPLSKCQHHCGERVAGRVKGESLGNSGGFGPWFDKLVDT